MGPELGRRPLTLKPCRGLGACSLWLGAVCSTHLLLVSEKKKFRKLGELRMTRNLRFGAYLKLHLHIGYIYLPPTPTFPLKKTRRFHSFLYWGNLALGAWCAVLLLWKDECQDGFHVIFLRKNDTAGRWSCLCVRSLPSARYCCSWQWAAYLECVLPWSQEQTLGSTEGLGELRTASQRR